MTQRRPALDSLPDWPRLMARDIAAAYCGVSANNIERIFNVAPVRLNARRVLYDRRDLDAAIERLKGNGYAADPIMEAVRNAGKNALR